MNLSIFFATAPTSLEIGGWSLVAFTVLAGLNSALKLADRFKEQPPPSTTYQPKGDYATRSEVAQLRSDLAGQLNALHTDHQSLRDEIREDKSVLLQAGEERAGKLHERINDVAEDVRGLETATELQNQSLTRMDAKIDRLIERK
jgi:hypothetical protein